MKDHCREFAADLDGLAAGILPSGERAAVDEHLAGCAHCRERYERTRLLCAELCAAGNPAGPANAAAWSLRNRVRAAISDARPRAGVRWLPAAAMAGALALAALIVGKTGPQPSVASPVTISSTSPLTADPPLTLLACERAAAHSDAALDQLLARDAARPLTSDAELLRSFPPNVLAAFDPSNRLP